ncbi:hypothetical protein DEAC_c39510 [Desulfosporosinus acididurans]|uniref:Uncharacterized protein n=1 Tax=Desulfosporosinus acididurans TaxID=476652 RepID=A0A0J1IHI3_9FIRM|nr:hypothetical protein [Desulfosporosinus acididurans]KLU64136.1 hypothetical protein DEAC_c39510 [Desulfosporosinus acididurans]
MGKRNIIIGVTPVEFDNMPESLIGKFTLAVVGVRDLYNKMTNEWAEEHNIDLEINNKCNMQKAISISMTKDCISLEALSILMSIGKRPVLISLAQKSGIPHLVFRVKNRVLFMYNLFIFNTLEDAANMAKLLVTQANDYSSVLERYSFEATGLISNASAFYRKIAPSYEPSSQFANN